MAKMTYFQILAYRRLHFNKIKNFSLFFDFTQRPLSFVEHKVVRSSEGSEKRFSLLRELDDRNWSKPKRTAEKEVSKKVKERPGNNFP